MSFLIGDPDELHAIADRITRHADAVRVSAGTLAAAVAGDHWHGFASDVFDAEAAALMHAMRACAARLDDAADALRRHAGRVQAVLDEVKRVWHAIEGVGMAVVHEIGDVAAGASEIVVDGSLLDTITPVLR